MLPDDHHCRSANTTAFVLYAATISNWLDDRKTPEYAPLQNDSIFRAACHGMKITEMK